MTTNVIAFRPKYLKTTMKSDQLIPKEYESKKSKQTRENAKDVYTVEEAKAMCDYFKNHNEWIHYMVFSLSFNFGRRIGDILSLRWSDIYDPQTGDFRDCLNIREEKTGKFASPVINDGVKEAVHLYLDNVGINPENDGYEDKYNGFIFMQHSGTHKGHVLTYAGAYKGVKRAAERSGIKSRVATHSARRLYGKTIEAKIDKYSEDVGRVFTGFINADRSEQKIDNKYIVSFSTPNLRSIVMMALEKGIKCKSDEDKMNAINDVLSYAETLLK